MFRQFLKAKHSLDFFRSVGRPLRLATASLGQSGPTWRPFASKGRRLDYENEDLAASTDEFSSDDETSFVEGKKRV